MSVASHRKRERTPPNADGDFYVEEGTCLACMAPEHEAPELMGFEEPHGCFFRRQPETPLEIDHALNAIHFSCVQALRYAGNDETIIHRLRARGYEHLCDAVSDEAKSNK